MAKRGAPVLLVALIMLVLNSACQGSKAREVRGDVYGKVIDGQTGAAINGANVFPVETPEFSATTSASGDFSLERIYAMPQNLRAVATGYLSGDLEVNVPEGVISGANIVLLPTAYATNKVVIVLTWSLEPADLDSHLYVPDGSPFYEVSYAQTGDSSLASTPFAALDVDDVDGQGPETTTIKFNGNSTHFNGTYRFFVHNFSVTPGFSVSGAQVRVYLNGVLTKTYSVPTTGTTEEYWHVFDIQGSTITDFNVLSATVPTTP